MLVTLDDQVPAKLVEVPPTGPLFDSTVELGDRFRGLLGFLPRKGFLAAAEKKHLLGIVLDDRLAGYACFDLTRRYVRLVHLCVEPEFRKRGVARLLIQELRRRYAVYPGTLARCRNDYEAASVWSRLGFHQRREFVGRSQAGLPLTVWWLDHGHPTLFTQEHPEPLLQAAIDFCILRDLATDKDRRDAKDSQALTAIHVAEQLELVATPTLYQEATTLEDAGKRQACIHFIDTLTKVEADHAGVKTASQLLLDLIKDERRGYPVGQSDTFDLQHVSSCVAAKVSVFVTRDEDLIRTLSPASADAGVRILTPADVVVHLEELAAAERFRPADLGGTSFQTQRLGTGFDGGLTTFVNRLRNERPRDLTRRWRDAALAHAERLSVRDRDGKVVAVWVVHTNASSLLVPMMRVSADRLGDTIARQVLFMLRRHARNKGIATIIVTDPYPSRAFEAAMIDDGYVQIGDMWHAFCIDACTDSQSIEEKAVEAARQADLPPPSRLRSGMPAIAAALIERAWWPAKIVDSQMACYVVPIQQRYASDLFGHPVSILERDATLGLSREHVYYNRSRSRLSAPARILWYMSGTGQQVLPVGVFACSQLDDVVVGTPDQLHNRYRHLGVWDLAQLRRYAQGGNLQALRFSNTELFERTIPLTRLRDLGYEAAQWAQRVPHELFQAIYQEGRRDHDS